jgi:succinyl-CoA synthetase beta subunit
VPRGALSGTLDQAKAIAADIGYPIVIKAQSPELAHKSDVGAVIVGIADAAALAAAWDRLHRNVAGARPGLTLDGVLVEAMGAPGLEMVIGGRRDPDWGPVLMAGLGGVWIEVLNDVRLMPADLGREAIVSEIVQVKSAALLRGTRGQPEADVDAMSAAILRIGALMRKYPTITEIDINPLIVYPKGHGVLALDVLMVTKE